MLKSVGLLIVLITCITCPPASNGKLVDEESWVDFRDLHGASDAESDSGDHGHCQIRVKCEALRRVTVTCDAAVVSVGCGSCQGGYRADGDGKCRPSSVAAAKLSAGSGSDTDRLIDSLAAASVESKHTDLQRRGSEDAGAPAREDDAARPAGSASASNRSVGGPAAPLPPPHSPPAHRAPPGNEDWAFFVIIGTTCGLGLLLIVICSICWYKYNFASKQADKDFTNTEYVRSASGSAGDGKLALSAQMYHYQHQKQQMLAMERSNSDLQRDVSDDDSDLENDEADFTVYECPGLAPTKEMEVRNPLFKEDVETAAPRAGTSGSSSASAGK